MVTKGILVTCRLITGVMACIALTGITEAQEILVYPYLQPGNASGFSSEQKVLIWQTDSVPAAFEVTFHLKGATEADKKAKVTSVELNFTGETSRLYRAVLPKLKFDTAYAYAITKDGTVWTQGEFPTRTRANKTRFVVLGDFGSGSTQEAAIAQQIQQRKPQFVLTTGDNVYSSGTAREYLINLFPQYNVRAGEAGGVGLLNTIPFYMLLGNHDVRSSNLDKYPDGMAFFYYTDLPMNAPVPKLHVSVEGAPEKVKAFQKNAKPRFPKTANYSFDFGNVHVVCLDANLYANPLDPAIVEWLKTDLKNTRADWKIVAFHHPGFNTSKAHYNDQQMRLLSPLFEQLSVDLVLTGHVHNYQRSMPLRFSPKTNATGDQYLITEEGRVDGTFRIDSLYDGITHTKPEGIIYVVTGSGGAALYDAAFTNAPEQWKQAGDENWALFTKKFISNIHSFTFIETDGGKLRMDQVALNGNVIDSVTITK